jgi:uncharacterized RDD family membrane protein YckC
MLPITILNKDNVPMGPYTRAQVADKLQGGEVSLESLAFVDGLTEWTPLRTVLAKVDAMAPSAPAMPTAPTPASSGYSYAATMAPPDHFVYAGFWLRFAAIFLDGIILSPLAIISIVLSQLLKESEGQNIGVAMIILGYTCVAFVARWLYFALMESSGWQATLGKKALGIKVTGLDGQRIGFGRATGRYFGKIISALILMIGFMMAGFTERKQALHDLIAGTLVIRQ